MPLVVEADRTAAGNKRLIERDNGSSSLPGPAMLLCLAMSLHLYLNRSLTHFTLSLSLAHERRSISADLRQQQLHSTLSPHILCRRQVLCCSPQIDSRTLLRRQRVCALREQARHPLLFALNGDPKQSGRKSADIPRDTVCGHRRLQALA